MARKQLMHTHNHGIVHICTQSTSPTDFGAKRNNKGLGGLNRIVTLRFCMMSKRQEDIEWAERHDVTLSLKIKTPFCNLAKQGMEAVINRTQYHINLLDCDQDRREMYLYLTEVRKIA